MITYVSVTNYKVQSKNDVVGSEGIFGCDSDSDIRAGLAFSKNHGCQMFYNVYCCANAVQMLHPNNFQPQCPGCHH